MEFEKTFGRKPVFGMIHTAHSGDKGMLELAKMEIEICLRHGVFPLIENYFGSTDDCEEVLRWMHSEHNNAVYGVNIIGNYNLAFELAGKYGAKFIQIDSVCGHLPPDRDEQFAEELSCLRKKYPEILLFGGVRFKYKPVKSGRSVSEDLKLGSLRCDAIVCTGIGTGQSTPLEKVKDFKNVLGNMPVIVGAGVTSCTAFETAIIADGAIVGSWLKEGHKDIGIVDYTYVYVFMRNWRKGATEGTVREGEDLYEELMNNDNYKGERYNWNKTDNDGMQTVNSFINENWIQRYLLDHNRKKAYEIMDDNQRWMHFSDEDIDWESLKPLDRGLLWEARNLSADFKSFIGEYDNNVAIIKWTLFAGYEYWGEEDYPPPMLRKEDFEITSDIYAVVDTNLNVLVKFRFIDNFFLRLNEELKSMKEEAIRKLSERE